MNLDNIDPVIQREHEIVWICYNCGWEGDTPDPYYDMSGSPVGTAEAWVDGPLPSCPVCGSLEVEEDWDLGE